MDGAKKPYKEPLFAALCYDPRMTNPALKILLALIALALTTDAALAHDLTTCARQCRGLVRDLGASGPSSLEHGASPEHAIKVGSWWTRSSR